MVRKSNWHIRDVEESTKVTIIKYARKNGIKIAEALKEMLGNK